VGELWQKLAFLESKEWLPVSEELISEGKQKGVILPGRSYAAMLCSVDKDDEKFVGLKPVSVTPLDLLPSMLVDGSEEARLAVNCYECDVRVSRSSAVLSSVAAKKMKEMNGSCVFYWLKKLQGFSRSVKVRVRGYMGRLVGLGFKPNGFRPKNVNKKPIIHLNPVIKSADQSFKLFFMSTLQYKDVGCGHSALVASNEISLSETLTEEGFGSVSVASSVLGLPKVGYEMVVSSCPTLLTSLLAQESAMASLELLSSVRGPLQLRFFYSLVVLPQGLLSWERYFVFLVQWR